RKRSVDGIAEGIKYGGNFEIDLGIMSPDVGHGEDDIFGKGAGTIHPHSLGVSTEMPAAGQTVAAAAAGHMPFPADPFPGMKIGDVGAYRNHFAHELVTDNHRDRDGSLRPGVPVVNVQVGTADAGEEDSDLDIIDAGLGFGDLLEPQTSTGGKFSESLHWGSFQITVLSFSFLKAGGRNDISSLQRIAPSDAAEDDERSIRAATGQRRKAQRAPPLPVLMPSPGSYHWTPFPQPFGVVCPGANCGYCGKCIALGSHRSWHLPLRGTVTMQNETLAAEFRRSSRVAAELPIRVTSLAGTYFSEMCKTLVVNAHGCALQTPVRFDPGIPLRFHSKDGRETTAHVVSCQPIGPDNRSWRLAAQLDRPENFWRLTNCPKDWALPVPISARPPQIAASMIALPATQTSQPFEAKLDLVAQRLEAPLKRMIAESLGPL